MKTAVGFCFAVAVAFLLGLSCASRPPVADEPSPLSVEAFDEYQRLLKLTSEQAKEIDRLKARLSGGEVELPDPVDA